MNKSIELLLMQNEMKLMKGNKYSSIEELNELILDDFKEFGSSGITYSKKDILEYLISREEANGEIFNLEVRVLSENTIQLTYIAEMRINEGVLRKTLRSSIWIKNNEKWGIIFHQGTIIK